MKPILRPSDDALARMRYDSASRNVVLAYLIWFFLGYGGVHRMYVGRWISGFIMLVILGLSMFLALFIGFIGLALTTIWWAIDALLLAGMVRRYNNRLIDQIAR